MLRQVCPCGGARLGTGEDMRFWLTAACCVVLMGCKEEKPQTESLIRGLKTHEVSQTEDSSQRRFPAVLEASELTTLSFEVSGRLETVSLDVGQRLSEGDEIAKLDPTSLQLQVETARAAVSQAASAAKNAEATYERQRELLARGATTRVVVDDALTQLESANASLEQAETSLESATQNLEKAVLTAPFDAIINSVDVQSFSTVAVGTPVATIYPADSFEVSFSVNFATVNQLVVGKPAEIRLADRPDIELAAVVSEIGSRADAVSSFPIVLELEESHPLLKAGMAVEASISFPIAVEKGFTIPLSAVIKDGQSGQNAGADTPARLSVYVFDPQTSTVKRREVTVGGVSENAIIVIEGLEIGERIASAGVSFLRDGQEVKLLESEN